MADEPPEHPDAATAGLQEKALAEQLALKDRELDVAAEGITIADARLPTRPLIYANDGFERVTGYSADEVLGRNCRFLQGRDSDPAAVAESRRHRRAARVPRRDPELPAGRQLVLEPPLDHSRPQRLRDRHPLHRDPVGCDGNPIELFEPAR